MSITYTYEIISVDEVARCMEVIYSAEGHQTMHIGARLPFEGEQLEDVIRVFAPVPLWVERALAVVVPTVGVSGVIVPQVLEPVEQQQTAPTAPSGEIPQAVL